MRVIVIGLGIQGRKRRAIAGPEVVATIDPAVADADCRTLDDIPADSYEAALVCTPDDAKLGLLTTLLGNHKHVLVEKPLLGPPDALAGLADLARTRRLVCYTAYNHRFEPHFVRMREALASGVLGKIYLCRMFYGNGTARDVRNSPWRDCGAGVLPDLGSHLLDTAMFWFGNIGGPLTLWSANRFENRAWDHLAFGTPGRPSLAMEITLVSWRNHFTADVYGEHGSAHIESLCKWGPSSFIRRTRVLPSGRPPEEIVTLVQPDPTWAAEYRHFKELCRTRRIIGDGLGDAVRLNAMLSALAGQAAELDRRS
jgi:scyllo-inositol 2-dehydrogenase (NADP+)